MRMKTVVFDLDGTLADTSADLLAAANACFTALGHAAPLDAGDALTAFHGGRAMLRLGYSRLRPDLAATEPAIEVEVEAEVERQYPQLLAHYSEAICEHTRLYPGTLVALEALRTQGYALSICTNKPEALAEELLRRLGVRGLFGTLVGADTLPVRKPDPAPYIAAVERLGGRVAASMLVGDTQTDRLTGLAAGVPVALVTFGPEGRGVARFDPEALLDDYADLPQLAAALIGAA